MLINDFTGDEYVEYSRWMIDILISINECDESDVCKCVNGMYIVM